MGKTSLGKGRQHRRIQLIRLPYLGWRFSMRHHGKEKDEQQAPPTQRRPRLPGTAKEGDKDPFQALFAYAYLQAQNQRKQAVDELKQDADAISSVIETQHTLAVSNLDLQGKLDYIIDQARKITDAGGAVIALAENDEIVCRARAGLIGPPLGARLDPRSGISGECIRTGELLYCDDTETDPRVNLVACRQLGIRSILALPLILHDQTLGVVEIFSGWAGVFGDRESRTLKMLAGQILEALWEEEAPSIDATAATPVIVSPETQPAESVAESNPAPVASAEPQAVAEVAVAEPLAAEPAAAIAPEPTFAISPEPAVPTAIEFDFLKSETETNVFTPKVMIAAALVLLLLAILFWQHWRPRPIPLPSVADVSQVRPEASEPQPTVAPAPATGAHLTEIKYWSKKDYTSIAVFLDGGVKYQAASLHDPERIYFDLQDTSIAPADGQNKKEMILEVDDQLVERVRAAQKDGSVTRVVLDLKAPVEYNTVLSSESPYRLMIAVHPRGTKPVVDLRTSTGDPLGAGANAPDNTSPGSAVPPEFGSAAPAVVAAKHGLRIVIDPGHGGSEEGAIGKGGLKEKDLVLDVAHRLGTLLAMNLNAEIFYTRTDDRSVGLEERTEYANQLQADMFVSVHANSSTDPNARGIETYYMDSAASVHEAEVAARENASSLKKGRVIPAHFAMREKIERSHKLANMVQQALYDSLADGQLRNRGVKRAPFVVLIGADMPAVLAEISFLSSPDDERVLGNAGLRDRVADALYRGIAKYLAASKQNKPVIRSASLAGK